MSYSTRRSDLEKILKLLYEKLGFFEEELFKTSHSPTQFELKQQIKKTRFDITRYEAEYWNFYPQDAIIISEEEATSQLLKVQQAVESISCISFTSYPSELIPLLQDIRAKLEEQNKSASAKLKLVLPLIPAIASYELEMETEGIVYKTWESIKRLVGR